MVFGVRGRFFAAVLAGWLGGVCFSAGAETAGLTAPPDLSGNEVRRAREILAAEEEKEPRLFIREFRISGNSVLPQEVVQKTVYRFLGPGREYADVDRARAALEQAYREEGYQTVSVQVPAQQGKRGIIYLEVTEGRVAKLRVKGSRYFDLEAIKEEAPSMREGNVPDFDEVIEDIIALNQHPDRSVSPDLVPGAVPGTVEIALEVEDSLPLDASAELNNRHSPGTSELRLNGAASYSNLWQEGHTIGGAVQTSPQDWDDVFVYSGYYMAPVPAVDDLSLMLQYLNQNSDVSTLGGSTVVGSGEIWGLRGILVLPRLEGFYHTLTAGMDYRRFNQQFEVDGEADETPISYYPVSALYSAFWFGETGITELSGTLTYGVRGLGSDPAEFDANRYRSDGSFLVFRGELARTQELPLDFQIRGRAEGQFTGTPLISNEQFAAGGMNTVRGYLEAESLGDRAILGSLELSSPDFLSGSSEGNDGRAYVFLEGAFLTLLDALPEQQDEFELASFGFGSRFRFLTRFSGEVNLGFPLIDLGETQAWDPRVSFEFRGRL
ncbi:MAG: ShlB/FhaC/HecB family hemolysin secretion/activation protein [Puniceicoccaceae bacterium]